MITYLQITLCSESSTADRAAEGFLACVCALVDLQGAGGGEVFPTCAAVVLLRGPSRRGWSSKRGDAWHHHLRAGGGRRKAKCRKRPLFQHVRLTADGHLHFN